MNIRRIGTDLLALGLLALVVFVGASLVSYHPADPPAEAVFPPRAEAQNLCGMPGAHAAHSLQTAFGLGAYFILLAMISQDIRLLSRRDSDGLSLRIFGGVLALTALCTGLAAFLPSLGRGPVVGSGGYVGAFGLALLERHVTTPGIAILVFSMLAGGLLLAGETVVFRVLFLSIVLPMRLFNRVALGKRSLGRSVDSGAGNDTNQEVENQEADAEDPAPGDENFDLDADESRADGEWDEPRPRRPIKVNPPVTAKKSDRDEVMEQLEAGSRESTDAKYELPELDFLEEAEDFPYELLAKKAQLAAATLEKTFQEFGLNVRVVEIDTGPVVTQFELELEAGLRLSKVTSLADDLAIALRVPAVRVVASIPGKNMVGVEVPNDKRVMVRLRELIESSPGVLDKKRIPLFLGKDVSGRPLSVDLTKMPHLLIAGRTGTGKSVCLNSLILSILMTRSPDQVKMLLIDPKMVELSPYRRIPHLMHPVITDMKKAEAVLAWAVEKMEERYDLLARCGVRHLDGFNKLGRRKVLDRIGIDADSAEAERIPESMPYIVIIADEMADMMMTSGKDVEGHIIRLAQKSRAVGIHLVLATQKPTVDVITGLIKSNLPARISFQVASRSDSRVVLDEMGAERLLGNGDMLYLAPGTSQITRAQGTYVSEEEINDIIEFYSDREPEYNKELTQLSTSTSAKNSEPEARRNRDDLYDQAIEVVIREGRGSVSLLQRALGIGYGRGARLIDYMAEDGIVGDYNGSQAREVLYTVEQWDAVKAGAELEEAAV